jgi:hypothetical protein
VACGIHQDVQPRPPTRTPSSHDSLCRVVEEGEARRRVGPQPGHACSSRSHALLCVHVVLRSPCHTRRAAAFLVDLAGSEELAAAGAAGGRHAQMETTAINASLFHLRRVIEDLASAQVRTTPASRSLPLPVSKWTCHRPTGTPASPDTSSRAGRAWRRGVYVRPCCPPGGAALPHRVCACVERRRRARHASCSTACGRPSSRRRCAARWRAARTRRCCWR